jgi:hypothetical protein
MAEYLSALQSSTLPLPLPGVVVLWCLLYLLSHALARKQQAVFRSHPQTFIITEEPSRLVREQSWGLVCVHLLLTAGVFASAALGGPPAVAFLAGGWVVTTAVSIPITLRRILFQRALSEPGAASGSVTLSCDLALESLAFELFGVSVFVLILGLCLAHLALLGGAFFIGATAFGYIRKTRRPGSSNDREPFQN